MIYIHTPDTNQLHKSKPVKREFSLIPSWIQMNFYSNPDGLTGRYHLIQIAVVGGPSKKLLYDIMHLLY
jgi:hypothetical protein